VIETQQFELQKAVAVALPLATDLRNGAYRTIIDVWCSNPNQENSRFRICFEKSNKPAETTSRLRVRLLVSAAGRLLLLLPRRAALGFVLLVRPAKRGIHRRHANLYSRVSDVWNLGIVLGLVHRDLA